MTAPHPNLIKNANTKCSDQRFQDSTIHTTLHNIAKEQALPVEQLSENVTHILANIAQTAADGAPIKLMHLNSVAAFMAGVEALAKALPTAQDSAKIQTTLSHLRAANVGADGFVTTAVAPITQLGARKQELMVKYDKIVKDYMLSVSRGQVNGQELSTAAKQLQQSIDQAMRITSSTTTQVPPPPTGHSVSGTTPSNT